MADRIERWMTDAGTVRVLVATTTEAVADAVRVAQIGTPLARLYGNLLTGTALMQLAQCPADRVQCLIEHEGAAGTLLADVWPGPEVRGRASCDAANQRAADAPTALVVSRQGARAGSLYQSRVEVAHCDIAAALEQFCLRSEQSMVSISLATVLDDAEEVLRAGGLFVQPLPDCAREELERVTRALGQARFDDLVRAGDEPADAARALFSGLGLQALGQDPVIYNCRCSLERAVIAVRTLGADALAEIAAGRIESVRCEFCGRDYQVGTAELTQASPDEP